MHGPPRGGWLSHAGNYRVEHLPCPNPGQRVDWDVPAKACGHTIEGSLESGLAVFRRHFAPNFTLGRDRRGRVRIIQHVPIGWMAAALENHPGGVETNRDVRAQVELAGHSSHTPWLPDHGVRDAYAALMLALRDVAGIPLRHPSVLRDRRMWAVASGWIGHIDVPENSHWDSGALRWDRLFSLAYSQDAAKRKPPKLKKKPRRRVAQPRIWPLAMRARFAEPAPLCPKEEA